MGIVVDRVCKQFEGRQVLLDVSFEVHDGEFVTLLAPTGEGKTTLLRIIAGVEKPDRGRILFNGQDVTRLPVQKRSIAMVYQWFVNYPSMTVYDNIASPLRAGRRRFDGMAVDRRVRETAELLKIDGVLDHYPSEISGGQQQRLAIARALAKGADYIFLDEPLTNLDYKLQEELRIELKNIFTHRQCGAVLYATPQPVEALSLSTAVGFLHATRLLQYGPAEEVYHNPCHVEVGSYFSHPSMNVLPCVVQRDNATCWLKVTDQLRFDARPFERLLTESHYLLGIRAHYLSLAKADSSAIPIAAKVELDEVVGSNTELHLRHEGHTLVALIEGIDRYELGDRVECYLDPRHLFIFDKDTGRLVAKTHQE